MMTTVCVVRRGAQLAIAADSLVTFGDTRLPHGYESNDKLFKVGDSYFGMSGTTAHFPVLRKALAALPKAELRLGTRDEVFDTFLKLHPKLKEQLLPEHQGRGRRSLREQPVHGAHRQPARPVRRVLVPRGVRVRPLLGHRLGPRVFALGAMHAAWSRARSAGELARIGVAAGCEFDKNSAAPVRLHTIKLKR
jgi:ATP-dependent HslUV protease subunit HslV